MVDGDLVHFGEAETLDYDLIVTGVEAGEDMSSHYRLVDAAPVIDDLVDTLIIPEWSGRAGADIPEVAGTPPVPRITSVKSGVDGTGSSGRIDYLVEPGSGSVTAATFGIEHRLVGAGVWTSISIPAANGGGQIAGYANGNAVELRARALAVDNTPSAYTPVITLTIGSGDAPIPAALNAAAVTVGPCWAAPWCSSRQATMRPQRRCRFTAQPSAPSCARPTL